MAEYGWPIGHGGFSLVSYGSSDTSGSPASTGGRINFNNASSLSYGPVSNSPVYTLKSLEKFEPIANSIYPGSPYNLTNAPVETTCTGKYLLFAQNGLSDTAAFAQIQTQINTIKLFITGAYTYNPSVDNIAGVGGMAGDLVIVDAGGTNRISPLARLISLVIPELAPGQVSDVYATFQWQLLNPFQ